MRSRTGLTFTENARREQIVAAALDLIASRGYVYASVGKIAEHVGIAKSVVLYHFKTKNDIIEAAVATVLVKAASVIGPAVDAHDAASDKLAAYIRANIGFLADHRVAATAMLDIITNFRTDAGLRIDQAAPPSDGPATSESAALDPTAIFAAGVDRGEFRPVSAVFAKNALRAALDGAVWELARDPGYDVIGYGEHLVDIFDRATRANA